MNLRLSIYRLAFAPLQVAEHSLSAVRAVMTGLSLGFLRRDDLHQLDQAYYDAMPMYTSEDYNLKGLFGWEERALKHHFGGRSSFMVVGAGAGREVIGLHRLGLEAIGFECHPGLLRAGQKILSEHGIGDRLLAIDRDACPSLDDGCDGVIIGWGSYMLVQGHRRRIRLLSELRAQVPTNTPLLLSFFLRHSASWRFSIARGVGQPLRSLSKRTPIDEGDYLVPNWVHFFTEAEVESELESAGWTMVEFNDRPYGHAVALAQ